MSASKKISAFYSVHLRIYACLYIERSVKGAAISVDYVTSNSTYTVYSIRNVQLRRLSRPCLVISGLLKLYAPPSHP
jgi:hypothetical protein